MDGAIQKKWHLFIGNQTEGPFDLDEVREKLAQGLIQSDAFVWCEGMDDWKKMNEVEEFLLPSASTPRVSPPPPPRRESSEEVPELVEEQESPILEISSSPMVEEAPQLEMVESVESSSAADVRIEPVEVPAPTLLQDARSIPEPELQPVEESDSDSGSREPHASLQTGMSEPEVVREKSRWLAFSLWTGIPALIALSVIQGWADPVLRIPAVERSLEITADIVRPTAMNLGDTFPAIHAWISPIPSLPDVEKADLENLRGVAARPSSDVGPQVTLVMVKGGRVNPEFYVATNVPDGASFEIKIMGVPETLLGTTSYVAVARGTTSRRLAQIGPIRPADGRGSIPRGNYKVFVYETDDEQPSSVKTLLAFVKPSQDQPPGDGIKGRKIVAHQTLFLGGPRDSIYREKLDEYHSNLKKMANTEIDELRGLLKDLTHGLDELESRYTSARAMKHKILKARAWDEVRKKWNSKLQDLAAIARKGNSLPEDALLYSNLYRFALAAHNSVVQVQDFLHLNFPVPQGDAATFEARAVETKASARSALEAFKTKLEKAAAQKESLGGLPDRTGI